MPLVAERAATIPNVAAALTIDRHRSSIAVQMVGNSPVVVITAQPLRLDSETLFHEVDSDFGICFAIRLVGAAPALGILRRTETGFREFWRSHVPSLRPAMRNIQTQVEEGATIPVVWRMEQDQFALFALGGWNRQHRLWYSRLDAADFTTHPFALSFGDAPGEAIPYEVFSSH